MSFDYAHMADTAVRLITQFGQVGKLRTFTSGGYTDAPATIAVMSYRKRDVDGARVLVGDVRIYVSPAGVASIKPGQHILTASGKPYIVVDAREVSPAGVVVYFDVQARGVR
jgi:UDP-N-acetylglucosamine transferase subunit ALG13